MNVFKRKSIYLAVAAGLGAVGVASSAAAVTLSQTGTGEVLIYPYYTVRNGNDTLISVVNTTASAKAVKVRFLEGKNSREVLDFNLYLSANDTWVGEINATADGAILVTPDTSCSGLTAGGTAFVNYAYGGTNAESASGFVPNPVSDATGDYEGKTLDRTREGYFEIIEMGEIAGGSTLETAVTHSAGTPNNCGYVNTNSTTANLAILSAQMLQPTGGLMGTASIVNVAAGTDTSFDAVALSAFSTNVLLQVPGSILPDMTNVFPNTSTVFKNGAPVTSTWARGVAGSLADPVTAVLMHDRLINEFVLDTVTASGTDWVITMPTKRHYIPVDTSGGAAYTALTPFSADFLAGGACEPFALTYFNREELTTSSPAAPVSPLPPGTASSSLCWESTVLTFNNSAVLSSSNQVNQSIASGYEHGWARIGFYTAGATDGSQLHLMSDGAETYYGLPTVGFMVRDFVNGNVGGALSNYSGSFIHKYRTNIAGTNDLGAAIVPTAE